MDSTLHEVTSTSVKDKLSRNVKVVDDKVEASKYGDLYVNISDLNGLSDNQFVNKFVDYCSIAKDRKVNIIYIPVRAWTQNVGEEILDYNNRSIRYGFTCLLRFMFNNTSKLKKDLAGFIFIFANDVDWFAVSVDQLRPSDRVTIMSNLKMFLSNHAVHGATGVSNAVSKASTDNVDTEEVVKASKKKELVSRIQTAAEYSNTEDEAIDKLDNDEYVKQLLQELEDDEYGAPKFSNARNERLSNVNKEFLNSTVEGKSVKDMIEKPKSKELNSSILPVHSINDEWQDMKFINFGKDYDIDADIVKIIHSFAEKDYPVVAKRIEVEDTSTSEDYIDTYTVEFEDSTGKRFSIKLDVPKFINHRFLKLRGNEKVISGQLLNLPCIKTDDDSVQIVSNYNKIFIRRYGGAGGKVFAISDRLLKALRKYDGNTLEISFGDNSKICNKYNLPIDYVDLASNLNRIESKDYVIYFDQDIYYNKYHADKSIGIPYAIEKSTGNVLYYTDIQDPMSATMLDLMSTMDKSGRLIEIYNTIKPANKHTYSRASIMASQIPLIVVLCNNLPFTEVLKRAKINYTIEDKRIKYDPDKKGMIRFADCYMLYDLSYESSLLLNGLMDVDTDAYSFVDMNKKKTWLDFLDNFGGRILTDGLENFSQVFMDPITVEVCKDIGLPTDYFDLLIYGNNLLADTKYNKHTDIRGNRFRTNEIVASRVYAVLARSYSEYRTQVKRGKKAAMTVKRTAVIDEILKLNTTSDLSNMSPLLELEAANSATFKGPSGLNTDRAYSLDKRTYDETMLNKIAMATGFSANIGINRQTTMDMDIQGIRGYIKNSDPNDISVTKRFSATEAVTPFGVTRDDPFRSAMNYIQTSKHSMPINKADPLLITNGADEAMPYMVSDTYCFRAKQDGSVKEVTKDYMIVEYKDGTGDYISLKENVKKNSDGGFYVTIKLDTDLKEGKRFKENDILAYDKTTFSNSLGENDNIAYNVGTLARVAIATTDEGFEDSASCSQWISEVMGSTVDAEIPISLDKNVNIYDIVKVGQAVQEGDPLIIFQNAFDDKDANMLLKNITDTDFVSDLGRIRIRAKYTGFVQDIKIYRTCEIDECSDSVQKLINDYEKVIKATKALYKKYKIPGANTLDPDYVLPQTGILKNVSDGILIKFYIKYIDKLGIGDKITIQSANKGTIKFIFPQGQEPFTASAPDKPIHVLVSSRSFNARMVTSPIVSGALNKALIGLDEEVKKIMGIPIIPLEEQ